MRADVTNGKDGRRFGPIPARAFRDVRLTGAHFRLLGLIAMHDRLGRNGQGCFASQRRLARLLDCDEAWLSHRLNDLRQFGYVITTFHPSDGRRRVHRVVYTAEDVMWDRDTCAPPQVSSDDTCGGTQVRLVKNEAENGATLCADTPTGSQAYASKQITINTGILEANCAEARDRTAMDLEKVEPYLQGCEEIAASADYRALRGERRVLIDLKDDARLSNQQNDRAVKLIALIPS